MSEIDSVNIAATSNSQSADQQMTSQLTPRLDSGLVDRIGFVLAACETDEQLENAVNKYLLTLLVNVSTEEVDTRTKVMEILVHVNKRIKSHASVSIPVRQLVSQFQHTSATLFFKNFAIVYIKMGFHRLAYPEKVCLMPDLLKCLNNQQLSHKWALMTLFVSVFGDASFEPQVKISPVKEPKTVESQIDPSNVLNEHIVKSMTMETLRFVTQFFTDVLLLPYVRNPDQDNIPGGYSKNSFKDVCQNLDATFTEAYLEKVKIGIVRLLFNSESTSELKFPPIMLASADSHFAVNDVAENALRLLNDSVDFNSLKLVQKLCLMFSGDKRPKTPADDKTTPVNTKMKLKILPVLLKSRVVTNQAIDVISLVFESCFGVGVTNKLRHSALLFVHHVATFASDVSLKTVGPLMKTACVKLLGETLDPPVDGKTLNYATMAIAKLAARKPDLMRQDLNLLEQFFNRLHEGDRDQKMALQESLAVLAPVYSNLESEEEFERMQTILDSVVQLRDNSSVKQILIKYILSCFPMHHVPSRYFLLAITDTSDDVFFLLVAKDKPSASFETFLEHIKSNEKVPLNSLTAEHIERVCHYLRHCLISRVDKTADLKCEDLKLQTKILSKAIDEESKFGKFYAAFLMIQAERNQTPRMFFYLTEICHVSKSVCEDIFAKRINWARSVTVCFSDALRLASTEYYGTLKACIGENFTESELQIFNEVNDKNAERFSATCLSLAFYLAHKKRVENVLEEDMCKKLVVLLSKNDSKRVFDAAVEALAIVFTEGDMREIVEKEAEEKLFKDIEAILGYTDSVHLKRKENVVNFLGSSCMGLTCADSEYAKRSIEVLLNSSKTKQHDVQPVVGSNLVKCALGPKYPCWRSWLEEPQWRQPITDADGEGEGEGEKRGGDLVGHLLDRIIKDYSNSAVPHVPQTCAYWLSEILSNCPPHSAIQTRARQLQASLMQLLSNKNETVQDLASSALSSLFHVCGEEEKQRLIEHMMGMFMDGGTGGTNQKSNKVKITSGDEEIFSEGEVGKTPSGGSISTYKDLCSLATDMNKPDLVYKFISLSNHNMMWNSRKGAAFGFSYLAEQASAELEPHLPKLLPKLFRYKFDPNPQVRESMGRIWSALSSNLKDTVEKYACEICVELQTSLESKEWRSREAACLALSDFASHLYSPACSHFIRDSWTLCFDRCDDIKDSVRVAGEKCLSSLSRAAIKCCGADSVLGPHAKSQVVSTLVPVLVENGLAAKLKIVSDTSLNTIVELCGDERAGVLKPHLAQMMSALLDSLSDTEASVLNYASIRAGEGSQIQTALDSARASSARASRPMDCLVKLTNQIDQSNIDEVISVLCSTVQSAVGFSTKTGAAHVITLMTFNCGREIVEPHANKLVKKMTSRLMDKNGVVRGVYSSAIPNVLKVSRSAVAHKYFSKIHTWTIEQHDLPTQLTCAKALSDACRNCSDVVSEHLNLVAPLSFMGQVFVSQQVEQSGDQSEKSKLEETKELYGSVWTSVVTGTLTGLKLYLDEVITLCETLFDSQSWDRKAQAASAITSIAKNLLGSQEAQNSDVIKPQMVNKLVKLLVSNASGNRFWRGKELVVKALGSVCESSATLIIKHPEEMRHTKEEIWDIVYQQWSRTTDRHVDCACVACVASLTYHFQMDHTHLERVVQLSAEKLQKYFSAKEDRRIDDDSNDSSNAKVPLIKLQKQTIQALASVFPGKEHYLISTPLMQTICDIFMEYLHKCGDKTAVKVGIDSLESIWKKFDMDGNSCEEYSTVWLKLAEKLTEAYSTVITTDSLRTVFLSLLAQIVSKADKKQLNDPLESSILKLVVPLQSSHKQHPLMTQHISNILKFIQSHD